MGFLWESRMLKPAPWKSCIAGTVTALCCNHLRHSVGPVKGALVAFKQWGKKHLPLSQPVFQTFFQNLLSPVLLCSPSYNLLGNGYSVGSNGLIVRVLSFPPWVPCLWQTLNQLVEAEVCFCLSWRGSWRISLRCATAFCSTRMPSCLHGALCMHPDLSGTLAAGISDHLVL